VPAPPTDPDPRQFTLRWLLLAIAVLALPLTFLRYALQVPELLSAAAVAVIIGLAGFVTILLAVVLPILLLVVPEFSQRGIARWVALLWLVFLGVLLTAISARAVFEFFGRTLAEGC
jgi:hypothetical protein